MPRKAMRAANAIQLAFSTGFNLIYRLLPAYLTRFTSSAAEIGVVSAAYGFGKMLRIIAAPASDRIGVERAMLVSLALLTPVVFATALADSILDFALAFFAIGLLNGLYYTTVTALTGLRAVRKTRAIFHLESMYQLGLFIGPIAGGIIGLRWGLPAAFALWGALCIVCVALSATVLRSRTPLPRQARGGIAWRPLLPHLLFGGLLAGLFSTALDLALPITLQRAGFALDAIGIVIGGAALISALGMLGIGRQLGDGSHRWLLRLSMLGMGLSLLALSGITFAPLVIAVTGIAYISRLSALNASRGVVATRLPAHRQGTGMSLIDTAFSIGQVAGPLLAGALIDFFGTALAFAGMGTAFVLAGIAALAVRG